MPVGLVPGAKRRDGVDAVAADDEAGGREGGPEGRQGGGVQDPDGLARLGEEGDGAGGFDVGFPLGSPFIVLF